MPESKVECPFKDICKNFNVECYHCILNKLVDVDNYLVYKDGNKSIKYI